MHMLASIPKVHLQAVRNLSDGIIDSIDEAESTCIFKILIEYITQKSHSTRYDRSNKKKHASIANLLKMSTGLNLPSHTKLCKKEMEVILLLEYIIQMMRALRQESSSANIRYILSF